MTNGNDWGVDLPTADDASFGFGDNASDVNGFVDFGTDGVDGNKIGSGFLRVDRKGWYQFLMEATAKPLPYEDGDMSKARKPSIGIKMTVQASDNGTPPGAIHFHDLTLGGKGPGVPLTTYDRDQTLNFLVGCGILQKQGDKVIDPETQSTKIKTSTLVDRLNGKIVIGKIELTPASKNETTGKEYKEKLEFPWGRGVFHPLAKEVAHHKWVNEQSLIAAGYHRQAAKPNA